MKYRAILLFVSVIMVTGCAHNRISTFGFSSDGDPAEDEFLCRAGMGGAWTIVGRDDAGEEIWGCVTTPTSPTGAASTADVASGGGAGAGSADTGGAREPGKARSNAMFFPGGGHFYSGERTRGTMLLAGSAGALLAGALLSSGSKPCDNSGPGDDCTYDENTHSMVGSKANRTPLIAGAAAAVGLWVYGIIDAPDSARRMNARNGLQVGSIDVLPEPVLTVARRGEPVVGVQFLLTW